MPDVMLDVRNHSFFDVVVYGLPSPGSQTKIRIGNVIGFDHTTLRVPVAALRQRQTLVLYLHAIGSSRYWISPEVAVSPDVRPCLDIHSDLSGGLGMSVLYSRIVTEDSTAGLHCFAPQGIELKGTGRGVALLASR
jgi:hypothetical protein